MTLQWERGSGLTLSDQLQPGEDQLWPGQQPAGPDSRTDTADICTYQHRHAFSPPLPPRPPQSHWWPAWQTSCSHWSDSCHPAHVLSSLQWLCRPSGGALQDFGRHCRLFGPARLYCQISDGDGDDRLAMWHSCSLMGQQTSLAAAAL